MRVWEVATGREFRKRQEPNENLGDLALSRDGRQVLYGTESGYVRAWDYVANKEPTSTPTWAESGWSIALLPDGHRVMIADFNAAALWDLKTGRPASAWRGIPAGSRCWPSRPTAARW